MKAKKSILPGAAFAALVAAIIVYCVMLNAEKNALADYEKKSIVAVKCAIPQGTVITEENADQLLEYKEIDIGLIPELAILHKESLYQKIASVSLDVGSFLTDSMFDDLNEIKNAMTEPVIAGFKADDLFQVASGILRSGDRIHIYTADPETGEVYLVWDNIFVMDVFDSAGTAIASGNKAQAAYRVNILMEKDSVEQFYSELAQGSLRVVKALKNGG